MKVTRFFFILISVTICTAFFGGMIARASETQAEKLRIATLSPISGSAASWGIAVLRGCELAAEKINANGGVSVGNKRYLIELVKGDTQANADTALTEANRLIFNEKINFIVGPNISACTLAILPVTERNEILLSSFSYSSKVLDPKYKYSFRLYSAGREYMSAIFNYLATKRPDLKAVALIGPNDQSGWDNSKAAKAMAEENGLKIVFEDFVQRGTTDFFPVLTKLVAKKPNVIAPIAMPDGMAALTIQQARQLGYKGAFAFHTFHNINALEEKAGAKAMDQMIMINVDNLNPKAPKVLRELHDRYVEKYNEKFSSVANAVYPVLFILAMGIEKAGSLDTAAVAEALENLTGEHPYGGRFSMGGLEIYGVKHQIVAPILMSEIKNGKQIYLGTVTPPVP